MKLVVAVLIFLLICFLVWWIAMWNHRGQAQVEATQEEIEAKRLDAQWMVEVGPTDEYMDVLIVKRAVLDSGLAHDYAESVVGRVRLDDPEHEVALGDLQVKAQLRARQLNGHFDTTPGQ